MLLTTSRVDLLWRVVLRFVLCDLHFSSDLVFGKNGQRAVDLFAVDLKKPNSFSACSRNGEFTGKRLFRRIMIAIEGAHKIRFSIYYLVGTDRYLFRIAFGTTNVIDDNFIVARWVRSDAFRLARPVTE